jgi:hypothetical protein
LKILKKCQIDLTSLLELEEVTAEVVETTVTVADIEEEEDSIITIEEEVLTTCQDTQTIKAINVDLHKMK